MLRVLLRFAPLALALALSSLAHAAVVGEIKGKVTDEAGKPLAGVTVVVTSPALQGEQAELTDVDGYYQITNLPPGTYVVRFFYENVSKARFERQNVVVSADKTVMVNSKIRTKEAKVETFTITERAPAVDVGTTNVGITLTPEVMKNIPTARNFQGVLALTPGAQQDGMGMGFSGATGLENSYLIDGVNSTGGQYGMVISNLPIDFAQEVQVLTGGYNAEWGRATGGFVNIITKTGSNEFHGGAWMYTSPFAASPTAVEKFGQAVTTTRYGTRACGGNMLVPPGQNTQNNSNGQYCLDFGVDVGGPVVKDKLWFYVAFMPQIAWLGWDRNYRSLVDANQDGVPDLDPKTGGCPAYLKDKDLCRGKPPGQLMEPLSKMNKRQFDTRYNFQTKLTYRMNADNDLNLTLFGSPATSSGFEPNAGTSVFGLGGLERSISEASYDMSLRYLGKFLSRKLQVEAVAAYHRESYSDDPATKDTPSVLHVPTRSLYEYNTSKDMIPAQCQDGSAADKYPGIVNCPVQNFMTGGYDYYDVSQTINRANFMLRVTGYVRAAGHHAIKIGFDPQITTYDNSRSYTGGARYWEYDRTWSTPGGGSATFPTLRTYRQFSTNQTAAHPCANPLGMYDSSTGELLPDKMCVTPVFSTSSKTVEYASFLQDQWSILPNLTLNAGVRWEGFQVIGKEDYKGISIWNNWAPRIGLIYDPTGEGKAKIYGSYGRFFESMPLDINDRAFSAEGFNNERWAYSNAAAMTGACGPYATMDPRTCKPTTLGNGLPGAGGAPTSLYRYPTGGERSTVVPGLKAQRSDEVTIGAQYEVASDLVVGAAYHKRWLGQIIEDISPDYGNTYVIANPGTVDIKAIDNEIASLQNKTDPVSQARLTAMQDLRKVAAGLAKFPKASRDYNAFSLTLAKRFSKTWYLQASYMYARTIGNYPGLYQATNGQADPNITSAFDLKDVLKNMTGPLPQDSPNSILVSGYKTWRLYSKGTLVTGLTFRAQEGTPINVLGTYPGYGQNEVFILPRGAGGRTPWIYTVDLSLRYQQQLSKTMALAISLDLFNLFDLQQVAGVNAGGELYTADNGQPINNGSVADLRHYKNNDGQPAAPYLNFGQATSYQAPFAGRVGLRLTF
jgi:hypothetical protein